MDLTSRLRSIVRPPNSPPRELTYEPDTGRYEATIDMDRVADVLGGRVVTNRFGRALIVDRRYESDRFHGTRRAATARSKMAICCGSIRGCRRRQEPRKTRKIGKKRTLFVDLEDKG